MANQKTGKNVQIIDIAIKAHIVVGKDMDAQLAALTVVKAAHLSGDYSDVIALATIDAVKTEQKSRRIVPPSEPASEADATPGTQAAAA